MRRLILTRFICFGIAALVVMAMNDNSYAQEQSFVSLSKPIQHFASLDRQRPKAASTNKTLRSDARALKRGFLRFDRAALTVRTHAARNAVTILRPETQPVEGKLQNSSTDSAIQNTRSARGLHAWPVARHVKQRLSSDYGMRKDPFTGKPTFHGGIDIAAASGTDVLASASGRVLEVGPKGKFGNHVSIQHADGSVSMYGHLQSQSVQAGARVRQGQKIGEVGSTGRSTGAHLDFRVKKNGKTVNPKSLLQRRTAPSHIQAKLPAGRQYAPLAKSKRSFRIIKVQ